MLLCQFQRGGQGHVQRALMKQQPLRQQAQRMAALRQIPYIDSGPGMMQAAQHACMLLAVMGQGRKTDFLHQVFFLAEITLYSGDQIAKRCGKLRLFQ
jgi:hypothetical protein